MPVTVETGGVSFRHETFVPKGGQIRHWGKGGDIILAQRGFGVLPSSSNGWKLTRAAKTATAAAQASLCGGVLA